MSGLKHNPDAVATWANAVTVARVLVSPVLFAMITSLQGPYEGSWWALALWVVLSASDGIDGYLARRYGTTRSGAFLDPLADKVLVLGAMFALVGRGVFPLVPVLIITAREIAVSVYRTVAAGQGVSVPAYRLAKLKTVAQQLAVGLALLPLTAADATWTWMIALWVAVVLTVVTGIHYFVTARRTAAAQITSMSSVPPAGPPPRRLDR
jgi:CDP-diacylglycerol--glycerol-3-phosphate 3-phosphatidyltransferase